MAETQKTEGAGARSDRFVVVDVDTLLEYFGERFAIAQHDGRLSQSEARATALEDVRKRYRVMKRQ